MLMQCDLWCTRLHIPLKKGIETAAGCFGKTGEEFFDRRGCAVAAREIEIHPLAKQVWAQKRFEHADDFRPLFINGGGVEIVDFPIGGGTHGMRQRA